MHTCTHGDIEGLCVPAVCPCRGAEPSTHTTQWTHGVGVQVSTCHTTHKLWKPMFPHGLRNTSNGSEVPTPDVTASGQGQPFPRAQWCRDKAEHGPSSKLMDLSRDTREDPFCGPVAR